MITLLAWLPAAPSLIGSLYMLAALFTFRAFFARVVKPARRTEGVTILKPLYGAEPPRTTA